MNKYLIDTNCLISFVTDRNPEQQKIISKYFEDAADLKCDLLLVSNVITESVYVLEKIYTVNTKIISDILNSLVKTPGISIIHNFHIETILSLWPDKIKDYGDAIIASHAFKEKITIITFDQDFVKQLTRCNISIENIGI